MEKEERSRVDKGGGREKLEGRKQKKTRKENLQKMVQF